MKNYKTIREIAEEIGVSKQAIRNKIAKLGLQSSLQKNGNQLCVNEKQESLIKSAFKEKNTKKTQTKNAKQFANENSVTLRLVDMLQDELQIKNKQIEELNKRLSEANHIINQTQQLHRADKMLELRDKQEFVADLAEQKVTSKDQNWKNFFSRIFNK